MDENQQRIPAGVYEGNGIEGSEQYGTTKKGNDQIVIDLTLDELGQSASTFLIFTEDAAPYAIERLRALGWQGDDLSNLRGIGTNKVKILVKYETWEGKERMNVDIMTGGGRVIVKNAMDEQGKRAFAAKFRGLVAASKNGASSDPASFPHGHNQQPKAAGVKL